MAIKVKPKGLPRWVRSGRGTKNNGYFHWEYQLSGKYYGEGFYHTADEAYDACVQHQKLMDVWRNPEKHTDKIIPVDVTFID